MARDQKGRGRGQFQGQRGGYKGHGGGRGYQGSKPRSNTPMVTQKELKFAPQVQGGGNRATYATVKDAITQHIQKTYKYGYDIAKSLEDGKKIDLSEVQPVRKMSEATDVAKAKIEQDGFDIIYNAEVTRYLE